MSSRRERQLSLGVPGEPSALWRESDVSEKATRHIPFDGAFNFRDVGGLATRDGRTMRSGVLFRADDLSRLSEADLEELRRLKLQSIFDLRAPNERESKPDRIPRGSKIRVVHVPILQPGQDFTRWQFFWWLATSSKELDFRKLTADLLRHIAFECTAQVHEIVTTIADERNLPAVIHCTVGKDRTGYLAALVQLLAGVPREAVVDDYLATNRFIGPRAAQLIRLLRWMSLFRISRKRLESAMEAHREGLDGVLDEVLGRYGTVERYLREACGVDRASLSNLERWLHE